MSQAIYLLLEDGSCFSGTAFGADFDETVTAEVVFTTAMTGYLETLTDPSYYGQMVVQAFPLIGNYGVIPSDFESGEVHLSAYIVREWCQNPSNFRSEGDLDTFLKERNIPGICGIDTRALIRKLREKGVMNGMLLKNAPGNEKDALVQKLAHYQVENAVLSVSSGEKKVFPSEGEKRFRVSLWDFGAKGNIIRELQKRGCEVTVYPARSTAQELLSGDPEGVMLSNGPGDPKENQEIVEELKKVLQTNIPVFGICLGHQLLALAKGAKTEKLKYGHRGANQPVKEYHTGKVYITSQNHGYAVKNDSLPENAQISFLNLNDGTCEGIEYIDCPAFSVQFHPEACGGPKDTEMLFDRFIDLMKNRKGEENALCR